MASRENTGDPANVLRRIDTQNEPVKQSESDIVPPRPAEPPINSPRNTLDLVKGEEAPSGTVAAGELLRTMSRLMVTLNAERETFMVAAEHRRVAEVENARLQTELRLERELRRRAEEELQSLREENEERKRLALENLERLSAAASSARNQSEEGDGRSNAAAAPPGAQEARAVPTRASASSAPRLQPKLEGIEEEIQELRRRVPHDAEQSVMEATPAAPNEPAGSDETRMTIPESMWKATPLPSPEEIPTREDVRTAPPPPPPPSIDVAKRPPARKGRWPWPRRGAAGGD
jgi:hypothetical protein